MPLLPLRLHLPLFGHGRAMRDELVSWYGGQMMLANTH